MGARVVDGKERPRHVREGDSRSPGPTDPDRPKERDPALANRFSAVLTDLERPDMPRLDVGRARNGSQHL